MSKEFNRLIIITAICIALNVGLGKLANVLGLPFTMDTVGTILAAGLLRWRLVVLVAILSSIIAFVAIHPAFIFYMGTQITVALIALLLFRLGAFKKLWSALCAGLIIAVAAAVVSAPVTALVFGGISVPSLTALNALFLASGESLWRSVIQGSLIVESVDKVSAAFIAWIIARRIKV